MYAQVILQSETIQELTKTSQALALLQEQASELRKLADTLKAENVNIVYEEILFYCFYLLVFLWYDKLVLLVFLISFSRDFRSQKL